MPPPVARPVAAPTAPPVVVVEFDIEQIGTVLGRYRSAVPDGSGAWLILVGPAVDPPPFVPKPGSRARVAARVVGTDDLYLFSNETPAVVFEFLDMRFTALPVASRTKVTGDRPYEEAAPPPPPPARTYEEWSGRPDPPPGPPKETPPWVRKNKDVPIELPDGSGPSSLRQLIG